MAHLARILQTRRTVSTFITGVRTKKDLTVVLRKSSRNIFVPSLIKSCVLGRSVFLGLSRRSFSSEPLSSLTTPGYLGSTVYALSSGHGKCGVAVIRITGPEAGDALIKLGNFLQLPKPRSALLRKLRNPETGVVLDKGLILWFPAPNSFTGEDSCELQVHGGAAVIAAVFEALECMPGLQQAEPGEFTRRAFANGKLDLPEVEGLADLIHAETEAQRQQALRQMDGDLSIMYSQWRALLIQSAAKVAAYIDFSEDELIEDDVLYEVKVTVEKLKKDIKSHLEDKRRGERLRSGVRLAIIGEPNVGKSSVFNMLSQRPAAIVSPIAGTTRDVVENALNIGGYPVVLSDTAGMHDTDNPVEQEGVRRAKERAGNADLQIFVIDSSKIIPYSDHDTRTNNTLPIGKYLTYLGATSASNKSFPVCLSSQNKEMGIQHATDVLIHSEESNSSDSLEEDSDNQIITDDHQSQLVNAFEGEVLVIFNKSDLIDTNQTGEMLSGYAEWCFLSCLTGEGTEDFLELLTAKVKLLCGNPSVGAPNLTQERHRACLVRCHEALEAYLNHHDSDTVLASEYLRRAIYQIGKLTGKITSEDILDVVFRDFCIGK